MRKFIKKSFLACALLASFSGLMAQTGVTDNFNDNTLATTWVGNTNYVLAELNGELRVQAVKQIWTEFYYNMASNLNISTNPVVTFRAKTDATCHINVALIDQAGNANRFTAPVAKLYAGNDYQQVTFNFTGLLGTVAAASVRQIILIIQPAYNYTGTVWIDDWRIGTDAPIVPRVYLPTVQSVSMGNTAHTIRLNGIGSTTISCTSDNTTLIPNPANVTFAGGTGTLSYTPAANQYGIAHITLTAGGQAIGAFTVNVNNNKAPRLDTIPAVICGAGSAYTVDLSGINDGNAEVTQAITVTATSSNQTVIPNSGLVVTLSPQKVSGTLTITPAALASGSQNCNITVTVSDDGGTGSGGVNSYSRTFAVTVWSAYYKPPTIDAISDDNFGYADERLVTVPLRNIADGNGGNKVATITAAVTSSNATEAVTLPVVVSYNPGASVGYLYYKVTNRNATSTITVTVTNTGAPANSNGSSSTSVSFQVTGVESPITGYHENFSELTEIYGADYHLPSQLVKANDWKQQYNVYPGKWYVEGQNSEFTMTIQPAQNQAQLACNVTQARWYSGVWYSPRNLLDLRDNRVLSIELNINPRPTGNNMFMELFDINMKRFGRVALTIPSANTWNSYTFTFLTAPEDVDFDFSKVATCLFNMTDYNEAYTGTVLIRNLKIGDKADNAPPAPATTVVLNTIGDRSILQGSPALNVLISGVKIMKGSDQQQGTVTLTATSSNASLVPNPTISPVANGFATLSFQAGSGTGTATITVTGTATGASSVSDQFDIVVAAPNAGAAGTITINTGTKYQKIRGLGTMLFDIENSVGDMGGKMCRMDFSPQYNPEIEMAANDNSDPNVLDLSAFKTKPAYVADAKKAIALGTNRFIASAWSPPKWMKMNFSDNVPFFSNNDNHLESYLYDEFGEWMLGSVLAWREEVGVEMYAVSPQNEPQFDEPYGSCVYDVNQLRDATKAMALRFQQYGLATKVFHGEILPSQGAVVTYFQGVNNDATIPQNYVQAFALHTYEANAVNPGDAGASAWQSYYAEAQRTSAKKELWMTETSGYSKDNAGAQQIAGFLYNALEYGQVSAWNYFYMSPTEKECFYALKNFCKWVNVDADRVNVTTSDAQLKVLAFVNPDGTNTFIIINANASTKQIKLAGTGLLTKYQVYQTAAGLYCEYMGLATSTGGYVAVLPANSITTLYGVPGNIQPSINAVANQMIVENSGAQSISLTGITDGDNTNQTITVTAQAANTTLITNLTVTPSTINGSGSAILSYTPGANQKGVTTITVTVKDDGGTANGGIDTKTITFQVEVKGFVGVEQVKTGEIKTYPNPVSDYLDIELPSGENALVFITDINGRYMSQRNIKEGQTRDFIKVSDWANGIYFINVLSKDGKVLYKNTFIKQ